MEIVLPLGFADAIFRRERSDNQKYVCRSLAMKNMGPTPEEYGFTPEEFHEN